MIEVERINGQKLFINPDLIKLIEVMPDTVVTFTDGEKIILRSRPEDIINRIVQFRRHVQLPEIKG
jgi:flagellar protein FlbD